MTLLYILIGLIIWNQAEVYVFKRPILANMVGYILAALFMYPLYQRTYTDLHVYLTNAPLLTAKIGRITIPFLPLEAAAITFGEVILATDKYCYNSCIDLVLKHEFVHVDQYRRLGSLRFFALYLWYYLSYIVTHSLVVCKKTTGVWNCIKMLNTEAYENIPFEVEAREKSGY